MVDIRSCFANYDHILMEGALGERLRREFGLRFHQDVDMAAFVRDPAGRNALRILWTQYLEIAERHRLPFVATTSTRRVNRERMKRAGLDAGLPGENVRFLKEVLAGSRVPSFAGGLMGCRGDAYTGEGALDEADAREFHSWQTELFAEAGADFLMAGIMPTLPEAKGMAAAMGMTGLPYIISFTIRKDGRLIDGTPISKAVEAIDALTAKPLCYMSNCVHPSILHEALSQPCNDTPAMRTRFLGLQANTSRLPYEQLDGSTELLTDEPEPFAEEMLRVQRDFGLILLGGCCGTDQRHMAAVAEKLEKEGHHGTRVDP